MSCIQEDVGKHIKFVAFTAAFTFLIFVVCSLDDSAFTFLMFVLLYMILVFTIFIQQKKTGVKQ